VTYNTRRPISRYNESFRRGSSAWQTDRWTESW